MRIGQKIVVNWYLAEKLVLNWELGTPISTLIQVYICFLDHFVK